ncbi:MAG: peptide deformylase [Methylococcales bacterium]
MAEIREIAQLGAKVLRQIAVAVDEVDNIETRHIIADMHATLAATQGVGLAAPQIGESKRILIVASRPTERYPSAPLMPPTVMINPSFQPLSAAKEKGWEGCLSIPGIRALVPRYRQIAVTYSNEQGEPVSITLTDFVARVFQHEYDHLDGKVYLDSVENNVDIMAETEYLKLSAAVPAEV